MGLLKASALGPAHCFLPHAQVCPYPMLKSAPPAGMLHAAGVVVFITPRHVKQPKSEAKNEPGDKGESVRAVAEAAGAKVCMSVPDALATLQSVEAAGGASSGSGGKGGSGMCRLVVVGVVEDKREAGTWGLPAGTPVVRRELLMRSVLQQRRLYEDADALRAQRELLICHC